MSLPSKDAGHGIHHPVYGVKMKDKADSVGQECHLLIAGVVEVGKVRKRQRIPDGKAVGVTVVVRVDLTRRGREINTARHGVSGLR